MAQTPSPSRSPIDPPTLSTGPLAPIVAPAVDRGAQTLPGVRPRSGSARVNRVISPDEDDADVERYEVQTEVGRGGMGHVLRVRDADLERDVAMKVLARDLAGSPDARRMFVDEARVSGQLEHPNILPVHELGVTAEGDAYFTMKLLEGAETVREVIERLRAADPETHARFTFDRRVALIQQVCNALDHAHRRGVIHRDIKPANILLGRSGEVYLVDWGVAASRPQTTAEGTELIGTPAYMAPEQAQGLPVDARSDLYSLTAVLYELLTLEHYLGPPAASEGPWGLLRRVLEEVPADAETHVDPVAGRVPRMLSRLCRRGLEKDPRRRFHSARELEQSLQAWQEGCGPLVCPGTALQRGMSGGVRWIDRHPLLAPTLIIAALVLLLVGNVLGAVSYFR